ncbi:MAG: hypothetical protein V1697_02940 [Candidatus Levyibacteriota bacterium]
MKLPKILRKKRIIISLSLLSLILLGTTSIYAQQQRTMTIVPPTISVNVDPGGKSEGVLKVINDSDTPLTFTAIMRDFIVEDSNGTPKILPPDMLSDKRFSASSWIGVYPDTFTLEPQKKQELNYYLQTPIDARPGGHYAAVVYTPSTTGGPQGSGASVNAQIGTLFYIGINGLITEKAEVSKFFANPFQEYGPVNIQTQIKNLGDLHIKPEGNITISNILGGKVAELALEEKNIFPGGIARDYENSFGKGFLIGPYTAKFVASYGKGNNLPLMATVTFWVFPWKITLIIILLVVAVILGAKYIKKRKKSEKKEEAPAEQVAEKTETPQV